ncbi:MAG: hypothetical protein AAB343_03585 [Patescibacteria group bacterium]
MKKGAAKMVAIVFELEEGFRKHVSPERYRAVEEGIFQMWLREKSRSENTFCIATDFYREVERLPNGLVSARGFKSAEEILNPRSFSQSLFQSCLGCEWRSVKDTFISILRSHDLDTVKLERDLESVPGCAFKPEWLLRWIAEQLDSM